MSYCTSLRGRVKVHGVPRDKFEKLYDAIEMARKGKKETNPEFPSPLDLDTPWKTAPHVITRENEIVKLSDFILDHDDSNLEIVGVPWEGGTRKHLLHQLNWLMAYLTSIFPNATFSGRIEEHDEEGDGSPIWFESEGPVAKAYETKTVKLLAGVSTLVKQ